MNLAEFYLNGYEMVKGIFATKASGIWNSRNPEVSKCDP
jgi:hypothetical protein